jgi:L-lysine exporter family protein LysE/ArgO
MLNIALTGFFSGLSLIVAIGAQNAYVLRIGLMRTYVGIAVVICALSDAILIVAGTAGMGALVSQNQILLKIISWVGAGYLLFYGANAFWRARKPNVLLPTEQELPSKRKVILAVIGFTWLNPHVYLDTVLLLGSIGSQFGSDRWWFALGASIGSVLWFTGLGYGSKAAAKIMSRPITWRILDIFIGVVMTTIAISLIRTALT